MRMQHLQRQENVGLLIGEVRRRIKQAVGDLARPFRLSPQQFWLLLGIREREGLSLNELAVQHRIDEPTASRIVTALARQRLVHMADDPEDRRRGRLVLTKAGRSLAEKIEPLGEELRAATVEGFSPSERRMLAASLRRIVDNVDRFARKKLGEAAPAVPGGRP